MSTNFDELEQGVLSTYPRMGAPIIENFQPPRTSEPVRRASTMRARLADVEQRLSRVNSRLPAPVPDALEDAGMASSLVDRVNALERRLARIEQFTSPIADDVVDEILALVDRAQAPIEAVDVARRLAIPLSTAVEVLQDLARLGLVEECRAGRATSTISRKFSPRKLT